MTCRLSTRSAVKALNLDERLHRMDSQCKVGS